MFVQVAHYKLGKGSVEQLQPRISAGPAAVMATIPGFVAYYAFDPGDGGAA